MRLAGAAVHPGRELRRAHVQEAYHRPVHGARHSSHQGEDWTLTVSMMLNNIR